MKSIDILNKVVEETGVSQKKLAEKSGMNSQQAVFNTLNAKHRVRVDTFVKMMNALGYDVVVRNRVTDTEIEVTE